MSDEIDSGPGAAGAVFGQAPAPPVYEVRSAIDSALAHPDPKVRAMGELWGLWFESETVQRGSRIVRAKELLAASQAETVRLLTTQDQRWARIEEYIADDEQDRTVITHGIGRLRALAVAAWSQPQYLITLFGIMFASLQLVGMWLDGDKIDPEVVREIMHDATVSGLQQGERHDAVDPAER